MAFFNSTIKLFQNFPDRWLREINLISSPAGLD
jgi:hypothetical protein